MTKLTEKAIAKLALEPGKKDRLVFDAECKGLGVRITAKGTKTFIVQWTEPGTGVKQREPLGVWGSITLEQAREAARARLGAVAKGIDVRAERERRKKEAEQERAELALSFEKLVQDWADLHLENRSERYRTEAQRAIRHAYGPLLKRPAARITRVDALKVLDGLSRGGKPEMAARTLAYGRACFRWAERRGMVNSNPFRDIPMPGTAEGRDRVLSDEELASLWRAADRMGGLFGPCFQMLALTLQRRDNVAGMRWSEVSADFTLWTIPAARMKNNKSHDVHLSEQARAILKALPRAEGNDFVFTTTGETAISGFSKAKNRLDEASGV